MTYRQTGRQTPTRRRAVTGKAGVTAVVAWRGGESVCVCVCLCVSVCEREREREREKGRERDK